MKRILGVIFCVVLAMGISAGFIPSDVLFHDSFDRADHPDINANVAGSQLGSLAPLSYTVLAKDTPLDAAISGNRALVSVGGSGYQRIIPGANFALDAITQAGGLELSYTVRSGVDFPGTIHGQYSTRVYLGSQGAVENINRGAANDFFALTVGILGNGQVTIRSQGTLLHQATHDWNRQADNDIGLVVDTESFAAETENPFSFYINGDLVYSGVFEWKHSDDLRFALEAANYSAEFDRLQVAARTDRYFIEQALDQASIVFAPGDTPGSVTGDLVFSGATHDGISLEWHSSAPMIVRPDGTVYRPRKAPYIRGETLPVTITAVASKGENYASREFQVFIVPSDDSSVPLYLGTWEPFWRGQPVIGEWLAGGQGLEEIPEKMKRNSFAYQLRETESELPFADVLNVVRLIGGWNEGGGVEKPVPAAEADLVYKDELGELQYRWDRLAARLDPYISRGYTNLTLVLDNIPYCFPSNLVMESYGQVATPQDFQEWGTFVSNLCVQLVERYGFETANNFRFRQGTEAQGTSRFTGTQEDYFKIYDHSAAAVKSVLPGAKFGPFNAAGGISANHNVRIEELAQHCVSGTNYATGEIGSPFDFISASNYLAQTNAATRSPLIRAAASINVFNTVQAVLPEPVPWEVHEFGILTSESGLRTGEPGARGGGWRFHLMAELREQGLNRWYHWGIFDTFRARTRGLLKVMHSEGWFLSVLDRTAGGEGFTLNTSVPVNADTEIKAIGIFGGDRDWILAGVYNPDRLSHGPEIVEIRVPLNLLRTEEGDRVLWTSMNQTNAPHWLIRQDLEEAELLNEAFAAVPEQLASVRNMTTNATLSVEQDYLGERFERYEQAVIDILTLKDFPGTVHTDGNEAVFTVTLTPPETAVICIGPDRTASGIPYAWLDEHGLGVHGYEHGAATDWDGDGFTAAQEYVLGANPLDGETIAPLIDWVGGSADDVTVFFPAIADRRYSLYSRTNLVHGEWIFLGEALSGEGGVCSIVDTNHHPSSFYRMKIDLPE